MRADLTPAETVRTHRRRTVLWSAIGVGLGVVLLYFAIRRVQPELLLAILRSSNAAWGLSVFAATAAFIAIKAWRWGLLLRFVPELTFRQLHAAMYLGLALNFLVAHAGEFLRAAVLARANKASISAVFASVMVERALDFAALLLLLAGLTIVDGTLPPLMEAALLVTGLIAVGGIIALYLLLHTPHWLIRLSAALGESLPEPLRVWSVAQIDLMRSGLESIADTRRMLAAVGLSLCQWAMIVLAVWFSALAVGETVNVAQVAATFVLLIVGLMLPNSPMQIGTTQLAFTIGMSTGGMAATAAVAASLVYTLFLIVPTMVIGGLCAIRFRKALPGQI